MRMCGHAHHDDMLYLGKDPQPSWDYPPLDRTAATPTASCTSSGRRAIRSPRYAAKLEAEGVDRSRRARRDASARPTRSSRREARAVDRRAVARRPDRRASACSRTSRRARTSRCSTRRGAWQQPLTGRPAAAVEPAPPFDPKGKTFLEAVMLGVGDALRADPRVFVYGEDVGGKYGNAFLLLRPLLQGVRRPHHQLAAGRRRRARRLRRRGAGRAAADRRDAVQRLRRHRLQSAGQQRREDPLPLGRRACRWWCACRGAACATPGPYHSQNTEAWFYRTPGLKIVVPSTPHDARALMAAAVADPDPVLYYEHIALYRDPRIKQVLPDDAPAPLPIGKAALRRAGDDLAIISYGAYVHVALRVAETAGERRHRGARARSAHASSPLDRDAVLAVARHCNRVLIVHEDTRTGGIGESVAAIIQEEAFEWLDAPVRILGALDTPVPYSPPLEELFLPSEATGRARRPPARRILTLALLDWSDVSRCSDATCGARARTLGDAARSDQGLPPGLTPRRRSGARSSCSPCRWCSRC